MFSFVFFFLRINFYLKNLLLTVDTLLVLMEINLLQTCFEKCLRLILYNNNLRNKCIALIISYVNVIKIKLSSPI